MVTRSKASSAAAADGGVSVATRAAALSDEALKMIYRLLGGGDPGQKSRDDLVGWLASRPDSSSTEKKIRCWAAPGSFRINIQDFTEFKTSI